MKRKIIQIDEDKCNGCGACIPNCKEGALAIINGKARLVSDRYCDGLGACLGHCPQDAIRIVERDAEEFNEVAVKEHMRQDEAAKSRHDMPYAHEGCPSARALSLSKTLQEKKSSEKCGHAVERVSQLGNWPLQLSLVPVNAPYLDGADLLLAADCVAFSLPDFHEKLLFGKILIIACPKLDNIERYKDKLAEIFKANRIKSLTIAHMEVPCCFGLEMIVLEALERSKKMLDVKEIVISIDGKIKNQ